MMQREDVQRLEEIHDELRELMQEAESIVTSEGGHTYQRAKGYWIAQIRTALDRDHGYLGGSMVTMEETIQEMSESLMCPDCGSGESPDEDGACPDCD